GRAHRRARRPRGSGRSGHACRPRRAVRAGSSLRPGRTLDRPAQAALSALAGLPALNDARAAGADLDPGPDRIVPPRGVRLVRPAGQRGDEPQAQRRSRAFVAHVLALPQKRLAMRFAIAMPLSRASGTFARPRVTPTSPFTNTNSVSSGPSI